MHRLKLILTELLKDIKGLNITMSKCDCTESRLGVVDGDTQTVYCGSCNGIIGGLDAVVLEPADMTDFSGASEDPDFGGR